MMKDIPPDYESLLQEFLHLQRELDVTNQSLHDSKRQLKVLEALQNEYQQDLELINSEEEAFKGKYETRIAQLEEENLNLRTSFNEKLTKLELDLNQKDEQNAMLIEEISLLKSCTKTSQPNEDFEKLLDEILTLREDNDGHIRHIAELKLSFDNYEKQKLALSEEILLLKLENENLKESLNCKREEVNEKNDLIQNLQDELLCVRNELESLRSAPLDQLSKGNSLFAEVDDRRVHLQKTINTMKLKYVEMKRERVNHLRQISSLRNDNEILCTRWKSEVEEREDDDHLVLTSYKERIQTLESLIDGYKKDLLHKVTSESVDFEYFNKMMTLKTKEIEDLREKLSSRSLTQTVLSHSLAESHKETRKYMLESTMLHVEIEKLKMKIDDLLFNKETEQLTDGEGEQNKADRDLVKCEESHTKNIAKEIKSIASNKENLVDTFMKIEVSPPNERLKSIKSSIGEIVEKNRRQGFLFNITNENVTSINDSIQEVTSNAEDSIIVIHPSEVRGDYKSNEERQETPNNNANYKCNEKGDDACETKAGSAKENAKKVTFRQDTFEPRETNRSALRKGGVILQSKPIYIIGKGNKK